MDKLVSSQIVGSASERAWSQARIIAGEKGPKLLCVLSLNRLEESTLVDLAVIGAAILAEIEQDGMGVASTEQAQALVSKILGGVDSSIAAHVILAWVEGERVLIYGKGEVEAYLARSGKLARMEKQGGVIETRGELWTKDTLLLSTEQLVGAVGIGQLKDLMVGGEEVAESLAPLVHQQEETGGVAGVVLQVREEEIARTKWSWKGLPWAKQAPQVRVEREERSKLSLWIGSGVLLLLIVMIGVGMVRKNNQRAIEAYTTIEVRVNSNLNEAAKIGDLNPERARQLLLDSRALVEEYLAGEVKDSLRTKATILRAEIDKTEERALKKNTIELKTVVELSVLGEGLSSQKMLSDNKGSLVWLDKNIARVVAMNLTDRSKQIVEGGGDEKWVRIGANENNVFVLDKLGVLQASWKQKKLTRVIEADEFWVEPEMIAMFAGNIYVLDRSQSEIWKYPALEESKYGARRRWLAAGITPDLSKVVDMDVAGDIWLLTETGKLLRYSRGAPVGLVMEGYPYVGEDKLLRDPGAMYVTENTVYILEKGASRVVAVSQEGKFEAQYVNEEFAKADDLVVVDDKVYVLVGDVVKEFGL